MTDIPYHRIAGRFYNRPLWLMPSAAETIGAFLMARMRQGPGGSGGESDSGGSTQFFPVTRKDDGSVEGHKPRASRFYGEYPLGEDGRPKPYRRTPDGTAIVTVIGELANRGAYVGASSGIVTYEGLKYQLLQAGQDDRARNILIDMESPGGEATGAFEAAAVVREVAKAKPVYAIVNGLAASAGYALVSGATQIVTLPTGVTGSIGVVMLHLDMSAFAAMEGVKPTFIYAGAHKVDGNRLEPLSREVRERFQAEVDAYYEKFVATVAAGRKALKPEAVRATEALTYLGEEAVQVGLVDRVGTFEEVLAELGAPSRPTAAARRSATGAGAEPTEPQATAAAIQPDAGNPADGTPNPTASGQPPTPENHMTLKTEPGAATGNQQTTQIGTVVELAAAHPALVAQIRTEAATAERERILGIEAIAVPGHDELIKACKGDGKTTPEQAAMQILQAEKRTRGAQASAIQGVETVTGKVAASPAYSTRPAETEQPKATTPEEWKAEYLAQDAKGAALRAEFPTVESYVAFAKAEAAGLVKRLVNRAS
jgi:signal peptide peptidase SppA